MSAEIDAAPHCKCQCCGPETIDYHKALSLNIWNTAGFVPWEDLTYPYTSEHMISLVLIAPNAFVTLSFEMSEKRLHQFPTCGQLCHSVKTSIWAAKMYSPLKKKIILISMLITPCYQDEITGVFYGVPSSRVRYHWEQGKNSAVSGWGGFAQMLNLELQSYWSVGLWSSCTIMFWS